MSEPIINRAALRQGDRICRRRKSRLANMIMRSTAGERWEIPPDAWNHDAIICDDHGHPAIGDALMGVNCQLTTPFEWECDCELNSTRLIVLRPAEATIADGIDAANWWLLNVHGHEYDKIALRHLLLKRLAGDRFKRLGDPNAYYCSEGVDAAWAQGPLVPYVLPGDDRSSPGKTWRAWKSNALVEVPDALTEYGRKFAISKC